MNSHRLLSHPLAAAFALVLAVAARAEDAPASIKFSDPAKPGRLEIKLGHGDLRITAADTAEVTVKTEAKAAAKTPRKDGLRVISSAASFALSEKDNVITLDAVSEGWKSGNTSFQLTVPRSTAVVVQSSYGGDVVCTGLAGNLEINCMTGTIRLEDVAGGVVVSTMNGDIRASMRELREGSPLSFTSMNGEVVLQVPPEARASVRLRTQNGSVLTDFDETVLVTKAETTPGTRTHRGMAFHPGSKVVSEKVRENVSQAVEVSMAVVRETIAAVREGAEAARESAEAARRAREEANRASEETAATAPKAPTPPAPAKPASTPKPAAAPAPAKFPTMPAMPTISGGKLVTGTLNGGGPEISVATMNGDVTLRKLEAKK